MAFTDFIPAIGGIAQSILNNTLGMSQSKSLMDYQAKLNQRLIDQANQFNSPINQMARLRAAGLNPNLVYGGSSVTGNQSDSGKVSAVNRDPSMDFHLGDVVAARLQRKMTEQQIKSSQWQTLESMTRSMKNMLQNKFTRATWVDSINQVRENLNKTVQSIKEGYAREEKTRQETSYIKSEANKLEEVIKNLQAERKILEARPEEIREHIQWMASSRYLNEANKRVAESLAHLNDKKCEELQATIDYLGSRQHGQDLENEVNERMKNFGLQGMSPKDFFGFLKDLVLSLVRGK